jgi:hypothetical protein
LKGLKQVFSPLQHAHTFSSTYHQKHATTGKATFSVQGATKKTLISLAVLVCGVLLGLRGAMLFEGKTLLITVGAIFLISAIAALTIWIGSFKHWLNVVSFTFLEGVAVGAGLNLLDELVPGVDVVILVLVGLLFFVVLGGHAVKASRGGSPRSRDIYLFASFCVALLALAATMFFVNDPLNLRGTDGFQIILPSIFCVGGISFLAYRLMKECNFIEKGAACDISKDWEWLAAFSLVGALFWFHLDVLQMIFNVVGLLVKWLLLDPISAVWLFFHW